MEWQPIKTAPRDGTVLLGWDGSNLATCYYFFDLNAWYLEVTGAYADDGFWQPTHWQPLPPPPTAKQLTDELNRG